MGGVGEEGEGCLWLRKRYRLIETDCLEMERLWREQGGGGVCVWGGYTCTMGVKEGGGERERKEKEK